MWHYTCNNKTFDFKLLAIDEHLKTKQSLHFHAPVEYDTFDWQNTPHSTANCGIEDKPLLKITGTLDDDSFVNIARNTGKIKNIKI